MSKLPPVDLEKIGIQLNYFDWGIIRGSLMKKDGEKDIFDGLPETLKVKLDIIFTSAYDNPGSGRQAQAKKELKLLHKKLKKLEELQEQMSKLRNK